MLQTLRSMGDKRKVKIDGEFRKDLNWFKAFMNDFNGQTTFKNWHGPSDIECFVDASLMGLGAICNNEFYSVHLPSHIKESERIVIYEMINILIALRVWGNNWHSKRVTVHCDNHAVVDILDRNRTRDDLLGVILREIRMLQARVNVQLRVLHIMGEDNPIADCLSRVHMSKCYQCINELQSKKVEQMEVTLAHFALDVTNL